MMKINKLLVITMISLPLLCSAKSNDYDGKYYNNNEMMDFSSSTKTEIENYYNYKKISSLKGEDLKEALYEVISADNHFIAYTEVNEWYKITDRNWDISRSIDASSYHFDDDTAESYYLNLCYYEASANNDKTKAENTKINHYTIDDSIKGIDHKNSLRESGYFQVDKEHLWAKSHGFAGTGNPTKGAGTDLHHLVAADHNTNSAGHNNYNFGNVKNKDSATKTYCYYADGTTAVSGWLEENGFNGENTFEPTDEWKGDIARALLYMSVRYSSFKETNTREEPYLILTDDINAKDNFISKDDLTKTGEETLYHGVQKNLSEMLSWNEIDPVSDYEIKRNDLIYKNVQNNRNPFVDYPSFARLIYDEDNATVPDSKTDTSDESKTDNEKTDDTKTDSGDSLADLIKDNILYFIIGGVALLMIIIIVVAVSSHSKKMHPSKPRNIKNKRK